MSNFGFHSRFGERGNANDINLTIEDVATDFVATDF